MDQARLAGQLSRAEADLVSAALHRARLRCAVARLGAPRVRCMALERLLGAVGVGDRVQARGLPARAERAQSVCRPAAQWAQLTAHPARFRSGCDVCEGTREQRLADSQAGPFRSVLAFFAAPGPELAAGLPLAWLIDLLRGEI